MNSQEIIDKLIAQEQPDSGRDNVFFICEWIDEQFALGNFALVDDVLKNIDVSRFSEDTLVSLITFSRWGGDLVPSRAGFVKAAFAHLQKVIGDEVEQLRELE